MYTWKTVCLSCYFSFFLIKKKDIKCEYEWTCLQDRGCNQHERDEQSLSRRVHHPVHTETAWPDDQPEHREGVCLCVCVIEIGIFIGFPYHQSFFFRIYLWIILPSQSQENAVCHFTEKLESVNFSVLKTFLCGETLQSFCDYYKTLTLRTPSIKANKTSTNIKKKKVIYIFFNYSNY